jgi:hypothetical protein
MFTEAVETSVEPRAVEPRGAEAAALQSRVP